MYEPPPKSWELKPIKCLAQVVSGGTPSRNITTFWDNGNIPWVTPTDITAVSGKYISNSKDHITQLGLRSLGAAALMQAGAILMTSRATLGESRISTVPMCTNQGFKSLVVKPGVSVEFLYYQMLQTKAEYARYGSGSTFLEVGKKDTERFRVAVAPYGHQQEISKILSTIDAQIESTEALITKQERVRAGLLQDLFTRGVDENGTLRPPRDEAPHLYRETELGWLPKEWTTTTLEQLVDKSRPITYGILMPGHHIHDGIPVIKVRDISDGEIVEDGLLRTSRKIDFEYARSRLRKGDLLLTIRGTVGRAAIVPEALSGANITQDTARLSIPNKDLLFCMYYLSSDVATRYLQANTLGNAVQGINLRDVKRIVFQKHRVPNRLRWFRY